MTMRLRPALLDFRDGAHEDVESPVGLEVPGDVGDQLFLERILRRRNEIRIDPIVDDRHPLLVRRGELPELPARGRHRPVGRVERHEERRVHHPHAQHLLGGDAEFGVEAEVAAVRAIEVFAVQQHLRFGKHILEEQRFAPSEVGEDHVGDESRAAQNGGGGGDALGAVQRFLEAAFERIDLKRLQLVAEELHSRDLLATLEIGLLADRDHLMAARGIPAGDAAVLPGEVLVDEEDIHSVFTRARASRVAGKP